jgi:hypothetical protein
VPFPSESEPKIDVQLPCMPLLKYDEVPEFLHPSSPLKFFESLILGQFKNLFKPFCILMDTFQQLEPETIDYMSRFCMIKPVGLNELKLKAIKQSVKMQAGKNAVGNAKESAANITASATAGM